MNYKHSCVIDAEKCYKTRVLVLLEPDLETSQIRENIQYYTLQDGETLVDTEPPTMRPYAGAVGLMRPRWSEDTSAWVEAATAKEITVWEAEHPAPQPPQPPGPTQEQELGQMITDEQLERISQGQEYTDLELTILGGTSHV